jgi:hypothetical protein
LLAASAAAGTFFPDCEAAALPWKDDPPPHHPKDWPKS